MQVPFQEASTFSAAGVKKDAEDSGENEGPQI